MKLKGKTLAEWLSKRPPQDFPGSKGYFRRYQSLAEYLEKNVHPLVSTGAALADGIFLNDHGADHIKTVISRASDLVGVDECDLNGYEVYLLLTAIQVHDAGNIIGRAGHEQQLKTWEGTLEHLLGDEAIERRMILNIAQAHGGSANGDKDTISRLERDSAILGKKVRPRLLAAILRFADELADERSRAHRFAMEHNVVPDRSKVFHKYSEALHSVVVDARGSTIELHFEMTDDDARTQFPKGDGSVYLLDEIIERTVKMHRERIYCSRFMRPNITLDTISVKVAVFPAAPPEARYGEQIEMIAYRLEDRGYPERMTIWQLCPELKHWFGDAPLSGSALVTALQKNRHD